MEKRNIFILGAIIIVALFIVYNLLTAISEYGTVDSMTETIDEMKKQESFVKIATPQKLEIESHEETSVKLGNDEKSSSGSKLSWKEVQQKTSRIEEIYQLDNYEMVKHFDEIKRNQKEIVEWKKGQGISTTALERTKPEYAVALAILIDLPIAEAVEVDRISLGLTSQDWYFLKTFSESGDVQKLMQQDRLNSDYVNLENLSTFYSNNQPKAYKSDGEEDKPVDDQDNSESTDTILDLDN